MFHNKKKSANYCITDGIGQYQLLLILIKERVINFTCNNVVRNEIRCSVITKANAGH